MEFLFYGVVAFSCLIAFRDWRQGVFAGIALDLLRDPVRKIIEGQPVAITLAGAFVWLVVALRAWQTEGQQWRRFVRETTELRSILTCFAFALIPAAAVSCIMYSRGYLLAAVGLLSYVGPLVGVGIGFLYPRSEEDVYRLLRFYTVINTVALIGVPLEHADLKIAGLGGMEFDWIRYRTGYTVELISGFYRSPDIMGLHAAHVVMFSAILWARGPSHARGLWPIIIVWAGFCLLLSGRRKMIGIPLVFVATFVLLSLWRRAKFWPKLLALSITGILVGAAVMLALMNPETVQDHTTYAATLFTEGYQRANELIVGSTIETLRNIGILGAGLGTGTQGRYYVGFSRVAYNQGWQEDGVSRLVLEFGIPGAFLMLLAAVMFVRMVYRTLVSVPSRTSVHLLQMGMLSVVVGDLFSFAISHQQFSGDVVNALLVVFFAGIVLGLPRVYWWQVRTASRLHSRGAPVVHPQATERHAINLNSPNR